MMQIDLNHFQRDISYLNLQYLLVVREAVHQNSPLAQVLFGICTEMLFTVQGLDMEIIHPMVSTLGVLLFQPRVDNNLLKKLHAARACARHRGRHG